MSGNKSDSDVYGTASAFSFDHESRSLSRRPCSWSITVPSTVRTLSKRRNRRKRNFFSRSSNRVQLEENFGTPSQRRLRVPRRRKKRAENYITFERKFSPLNWQSKHTITSKCVPSTLSQAKLSILQFRRKLNQTSHGRHGLTQMRPKSTTSLLEVEGQVSCSSISIKSTGALSRRRFISPQESMGTFPNVRLSCRLSCPLFRKGLSYHHRKMLTYPHRKRINYPRQFSMKFKRLSSLESIVGCGSKIPAYRSLPIRPTITSEEVTLSEYYVSSPDNSEECMSQSESEMKQIKQHDLQKDDTKLKGTVPLEVERQASGGTPIHRTFSSPVIKLQNSNNPLQNYGDTKSVRMSLLGVERQTSRRTLSYRGHRLQKDTMTSSNSDTNSEKVIADSNLQAKHTTAISEGVARPNSEQSKSQSEGKVEKTSTSKVYDALNISDKDMAKLQEANSISEEVARPEYATSPDNSKSQSGSKVEKADMQSTSKVNDDATISDGVALPNYTSPPYNLKRSESGIMKQKAEAGDTKLKGIATLEVKRQQELKESTATPLHEERKASCTGGANDVTMGKTTNTHKQAELEKEAHPGKSSTQYNKTQTSPAVSESPTNSDTICDAQSPIKSTSELPSSSEIGKNESRSGPRSKEKKVEASNTSTKMVLLHQNDEVSGTLTSAQRSDTTTSEQSSASETKAKKSKSQSKSKPEIQVARCEDTDIKWQSTEVTSKVAGEDGTSDGIARKHQCKEEPAGRVIDVEVADCSSDDFVLKFV